MKIGEKEIEGSEGEEGGMHGTDGRTSRKNAAKKNASCKQKGKKKRRRT